MRILLALLLAMIFALSRAAAPNGKTLDVYVVDVEGGKAELIVTPSRESLLIDSGNVGEAASRLGPNDLLVVMSDHGFTSWRRSFNLNSWLRENGYLTLRPGRRIGRGATFDTEQRVVIKACIHLLAAIAV